jgi:hypothetical protein
MSTNADRINSVLGNPELENKHLNGNGKLKKSKTIEEQYEEQQVIMKELEAEIQKNKASEAKRQAENKALLKKQKLTNDLVNVLKEHGLDVGDLAAVSTEPIPPKPRILVNDVPVPDGEKEVKTSHGIWTTIAMLLGLMVLFAVFQNFAEMNDSQSRILNAAQAHFWTHIWLALGTILFGFGVHFAIFNKQFRYFSNNIETGNSWSKDFDNPTFEGAIRIATTFATWAFCTWVCASVMQLILG